MKKIIELPMLNTRTDCNVLAREVLAQCDLLHPSRLVEVEQTIYYLKKRKMTHNSKGIHVSVIFFSVVTSFKVIICRHRYP